MKKLTKIIAGLTALILTLGIAGCGNKNTDYPDFKPSGDGITSEETSEKYTVNVRSAGGIKLNGVRVSAYNSNGVKVRSGISADGIINFNLSLGEYRLEVDEETLPAGYYVEEGASYVTNPQKRDEVNIRVPSTVISQAATADKQYSVGEIIHDFRFDDYLGNKSYKLSDVLKEKKAVVLNFWYPSCTYCIQEFPALNAAYEDAKRNIEVFGMCFSSYDNQDVAAFVETHKKDFKLTFPLGVDTAGIQRRFNINSAPTTIVIDRYGMIALREEGGQPTKAFWQELFKKYAADDYVQDVDGTSSDDPGSQTPGTSQDREKPNISMPSSAEMAAAASGAGLIATYREDDTEEYSWPWTVGTDETYGSVITVTNTGKQNSFATVIVDVTLKKDELLSFDYFVSSEKDADCLYVFLDGQLMNGDGWSGETGWVTEGIYVADRDKTVELTFLFLKDNGDPSAQAIGKDCAKIKNIRTSPVSSSSEALDVIRAAASGEFKSGRYGHYVDAVPGPDGFLHKDSADGPLLYISLTNITPWSEAHTENNQFEHNGDLKFASLYDMTIDKYSELIETESGGVASFTVKIGEKDFATPLIEYHHMLDVFEKPYQLMPLSPQLMDWAQTFVSEYEKEIGGTAHPDEWKEFCFYYDHYGAKHAADEICRKDTDVTKGLTIFNPYEISFDTVPASGERTDRVEGTVKYPLTRDNGIYYKFTAPKNGIYQIRDYTGSQPDLAVYKMKDDGLTREIVHYSGAIRDFDSLTGTAYGSFNEYLTLSAGETVYLQLIIAEQTTGSFDFDITYLNRVDKLMHCATAGGQLSGGPLAGEDEPIRFLGINAVYDPATGKYFCADSNGEPDHTKPVYINMVYESFFMSGLPGMNNSSLETLINKNVFKNLSAADHEAMVSYLEQAKANDGLVEADGEITRIINNMIVSNGGGGDDGRNWMMFGCYMEHIVYPA